MQTIIQPLFPRDGTSVKIAADKVEEWENGYVKLADEQHVKRRGGKYQPLPLTIRWSSVQAERYCFSLSLYPDMQNPSTFEVGGAQITLEALFTGTTYYWKVESFFGQNMNKSAVYSFHTEDVPRVIQLGPVGNTRDIGGIRLADGRRIKHGLVYRGGTADEMTDECNQRQQRLFGIRTDLDLRRPEDIGFLKQSPFGDNVKYVNISCPCYFGEGPVSGIQEPTGVAAIRELFRVLSCEKNYPIYIHCLAGRDRTGTLVMLLEGMLGAIKEDMYRDYELSLFVDEGACMYMGDRWLPMIQWIENYGEGETFSEHITQYLLDAGVTQEELNRIHHILVG